MSIHPSNYVKLLELALTVLGYDASEISKKLNLSELAHKTDEQARNELNKISAQVSAELVEEYSVGIEDFMGIVEALTPYLSICTNEKNEPVAAFISPDGKPLAQKPCRAGLMKVMEAVFPTNTTSPVYVGDVHVANVTVTTPDKVVSIQDAEPKLNEILPPSLIFQMYQDDLLAMKTNKFQNCEMCLAVVSTVLRYLAEFNNDKWCVPSEQAYFYFIANTYGDENNPLATADIRREANPYKTHKLAHAFQLVAPLFESAETLIEFSEELRLDNIVAALGKKDGNEFVQADLAHALHNAGYDLR